MLGLILLVLAIVLMVAGYQVAGSRARKLQALPDIYPYEEVSRRPQGETAVVTREDGTELHTVSAGKGPVVLLAHGYGVDMVEWSLVFPRLVEMGYRVIAWDQRGHGKSTIGSDGIGSQQMAGDYRAVLEHYDVHDAVLVGHSMGGFLTIIFLLSYPEVAQARLKGVVLFAATGGNVLEGSLQNRFQVPLIRMGIVQRIMQSDVYGTLFASSIYGDQPAPGGMRAFRESFSAQNHHALLPIIDAMATEDYYGRLGEIQLPTVVICGRKDKTTPPWHSERMASNIPGARSVWLEGQGHMLNWEMPDSLIDVVKSF